MRIGFDLDGVLVDWNPAFASVLLHHAGRDASELSQLPAFDTFDWPVRFGFTQKQIAAAWAAVDASPSFWANLDPLIDPGEAMALLAALPAPVWFLTSRPGPYAHVQSCAWLEQILGISFPHVCVTSGPESKGLMARALELDLYFDDLPANLHAVHRHAPGCRAILVEQPWNVGARELFPTVPCSVVGYRRTAMEAQVAPRWCRGKGGPSGLHSPSALNGARQAR